MRRLALSDGALAAYRKLRADRASEAGQRVRGVLERLATDPGAARGESSRWETLQGKVWALTVAVPADRPQLILCSEDPPDTIEVYYIGYPPGDTPHPVTWTSESE